MTPLQKLRDHVTVADPSISCNLDESEDGVSYIDVYQDDYRLCIEHHPSLGFGLTAGPNLDVYGGKADEWLTDSPSCLIRVLSLVKSKKSTIPG